MYDYLIVGAGLFGATFAHEMTKKGKKCLVVDKKPHIGGLCYTEERYEINVHVYGAHIFRTDSKEVWDFVNQFAEFNRFTNCPLAKYHDELYNMPVNMNTLHQMFGVVTPKEAKERVEQDKVHFDSPQNAEEYCLTTIGKTLYEKLFKEYTEKQWEKKCTELSTSILSNLPVRYTYDNSYFDARYQGVPIGGYTQIFEKMLQGSVVLLNTDYYENEWLRTIAKKTIFTGEIDKFFQYRFGKLGYRSLEFKHDLFCESDMQGNAVVNYTSHDVPYTRTIEHKHFEGIKHLPYTIVSKEFPVPYTEENEPYYPVPNQRNNELYKRYHDLTKELNGIVFAGRLGTYSFDNMDKAIRSARELARKEESHGEEELPRRRSSS